MNNDEELPLTMPVPEYGRRFLNLGRGSSYAAARRGEIATAQFGRRKLALPRVMQQRLTHDPRDDNPA